ncbi:MAG: TRAP transporter small permease [Deltaproteobacteria bacterium]|nr:TRAP transporter small permease [Deltaproteobacteria bacterium]
MRGNFGESLWESVIAFSRKVCTGLSLVVFLFMAITTVAVIARYVFNHPLVWTWLTNRLLFGVFILFAGVFAMLERAHIRIEIFYEHFPSKMRLLSKVVTLISFVIFMGVLVWQATWMGLNSLKMLEKAPGAFQLPIFPFKLLVPVAALLFFVVGVGIFLKDDHHE